MRPLPPILIAAILLGGCDECEDTSTTLECLFEQDADRTEALGGIWRGTLTLTEISGSQEVVAIVSENDEFRLISTTGIQASGTLTAGSGSASGDLRFYPTEGETFSDDRTSLTGTFEGAAEEATRLDGDWVASVDNNIEGRFRLTYDTVYAEDSSLTRLAGNYSAQDLSGFSRSIVVQDTGAIEGSDTDGCTYSGTAAIIDTQWNAYDLTITVTDCSARAGDYNGLGFLDDNGLELVAQVTGGTSVVSFAVRR